MHDTSADVAFFFVALTCKMKFSDAKFVNDAHQALLFAIPADQKVPKSFALQSFHVAFDLLLFEPVVEYTCSEQEMLARYNFSKNVNQVVWLR